MGRLSQYSLTYQPVPVYSESTIVGSNGRLKVRSEKQISQLRGFHFLTYSVAYICEVRKSVMKPRECFSIKVTHM
jgi:hypothetical protein